MVWWFGSFEASIQGNRTIPLEEKSGFEFGFEVIMRIRIKN